MPISEAVIASGVVTTGGLGVAFYFIRKWIERMERIARKTDELDRDKVDRKEFSDGVKELGDTIRTESTNLRSHIDTSAAHTNGRIDKLFLKGGAGDT